MIRHARRFGLWATMVALVACASPDPGGQGGSRAQASKSMRGAVALDATNSQLLHGDWEGSYESSSTYGVYRDSVTLHIAATSPPSGTFKMGSRPNSPWQTSVLLKDGKTLLAIDRASQLFTLERDDKGTLSLASNYPSVFQGTPTDVTVKLKKK